MAEEEGGILAFLDTVVEIETILPPTIEETIPEEEPLEETEYKPRDYREKKFETYLCAYLTEKGYQYERQKRCANGVIDIFVYDKIPWIIEVKRYGTPFYLIQGIAQLKFYARCFSSSQLYIATPEEIREEYRLILDEFGIGRWCGHG
jgi:Holliday junction resolvase-like predicted endonuclease